MGAKRLKFLLGVCCNLSLLSKMMGPCNLWKLETLVNNDGNGKWPNSWKFQSWNRIELILNSYWNHPKLLQFLCVAPSCKLTTCSKERDGGARTFAATAACRAKMVLKSGKLPPIVAICCDKLPLNLYPPLLEQFRSFVLKDIVSENASNC